MDSPKKPKTGRPLKPIDVKQVEFLAAKFWSMREIAAFFNVDESTIRSRFPAEWGKGRERGKARLRDLQLRAAEKGSHVMLIWLGKQYLDQAEKAENTNLNVGVTAEQIAEIVKKQNSDAKANQ